MNFDELKEKSKDELNKSLSQLQKDGFKLRVNKAIGQLNQSHLLKANRKEIARVKTAINLKSV